MNGAAALAQKMALRLAGRTQAAKIFGAVAVLSLEGDLAHAQERGRARDVVPGQVDETLPFAADGAAGWHSKRIPPLYIH
jgi:hypothetical protein